MIALVLAVAAVFGALMAVSVYLEPLMRWFAGDDIGVLLARSILAPAIAAWITAELVNMVRPLRLLDRRIRRFIPCAIVGLAAGVVGAVIASFLLAIAGETVHEVIVLAGSGAVGTAIVLAPLRRVRGPLRSLRL